MAREKEFKKEDFMSIVGKKITHLENTDHGEGLILSFEGGTALEFCFCAFEGEITLKTSEALVEEK